MRTATSRKTIWHELLRWGLLVCVALWIASPLLSDGLVGGGDAVWYRHQVADAVQQFRQGVFPVVVGQLQESFNGAVHPIRTAPFCQYLAGALDLLTGRKLEAHVLLQFTAFLSLVGAMFTTYAALCWLDSRDRWRAASLAVLCVMSPAAIGLVFAQDLYMSTLALPWIVPALVATLMTLRDDDKSLLAPVILGAALAALLWAHTPMALYTGAAVAAVFVVALARAATEPARMKALIRKGSVAVLGALLLGSYPVVSVLGLRAGGEGIATRIFDRESLLNEIAAAFPAVLQPLDLSRPLLSFMQPGYSVLVLLLLGAVLLLRRTGQWKAPGLTLWACALGYALLMMPTPGLTRWVWMHLPEVWVSITNIWPMQRLAPLIAALAVVVAQAALAASPGHTQPAKWERHLLGLLLIWSLWQASDVRALGIHRTQSAQDVARLSRGENINVSEICYQQLPGRPSYFIHGVTDPAMELRLLDPTTGALLQGNKAAVEAASTAPWIELRAKTTANPGLVAFAPKLTLEPGRRYLLTFDFAREDTRGVLRLLGEQLNRVYVLPSAGEASGFGTGEGHEKSLVVWTTRAEREDVTLEFIPESAVRAGLAEGFARVRLTPIEPNRLPVEVTSLLPLSMKVRASDAALLETMRVYIPGWTAEVNGKLVEVVRTKEGLAGFHVPAGESVARLFYEPPAAVSIAFWTNVVGWVAVIAGAAFVAVRRLRAS